MLNATPPQQLNPSGRFSRRTTRSVKIIAVAAVALLAANRIMGGGNIAKNTQAQCH
jgi:hypothetical protein